MVRWTYQRYTKAMYLEDKQIWYDISSQELAGELLKLRTCLNNSYDIAKKISEDETIDISERLEALDKKDDSRLNIVKLLVEYPAFVSQTQRKERKPYVKNTNGKITRNRC